VVTGPNTVIDAIAAGKRAALMIHRYLCGEALDQLETPIRPSVYIEPPENAEPSFAPIPRAVPTAIPPKNRRGSFDEVVLPLNMEQAGRETSRCLRCDLDVTRPARGKERREDSDTGER